MNKKNNHILRFLKLIYVKLFRIHDTPQKIALGFGLGVFLGIMPGTGIIAALTMAFILRVNRLAALLGSLLSNTWLSIVTFLLSIKIGSRIMGLDWQEAHNNWTQLVKNFRIIGLFKLTTLNVLLPIIIGYLVIGFCLGLTAYLAALIIIKRAKHENKNRINLRA